MRTNPMLRIHVAGLVGLAAILALQTACVTKGTYRTLQSERDALDFELQTVQEQREAERSALLAEIDELGATLAAIQEANGMLDAARGDLAKLVEQRNADLARLRGTYDELLRDFAQEIRNGEVEIEQLRVGIRLRLSDDVLFPSGSAQLNQRGQQVVLKVAERISGQPDRIEIEGHTDDVPLKAGSRYPTNWELAAARSTRVARILAEHGANPERIAATSFAEHRPVVPNESDAGRAQNRRIEIRLMPASLDERLATARANIAEAEGEAGADGTTPAAPAPDAR